MTPAPSVFNLIDGQTLTYSQIGKILILDINIINIHFNLSLTQITRIPSKNPFST